MNRTNEDNLNNLEKLITVDELEQLGIPRVSQWRFRKRKLLPYLQIGSRIFYREQHLETFYERCERNKATR